MISNDEKIKLYMEKIIESVDSLNTMISQILYENSKTNIQTEDLFEYVLSQLASHKNKSKIKYYNNFKYKSLYINKIRFSRAIINIINNSLDTIDKNGSIKISVISKNGKITIIIEDNGIGIDEKT